MLYPLWGIADRVNCRTRRADSRTSAHLALSLVSACRSAACRHPQTQAWAPSEGPEGGYEMTRFKPLRTLLALGASAGVLLTAGVGQALAADAPAPPETTTVDTII